MWVAVRAVVFHLSRIKEKMHTLSKGLRNKAMEEQVLEEEVAKIEPQPGKSFPLKIFEWEFSTRKLALCKLQGGKQMFKRETCDSLPGKPFIRK